MSRQDIKWEKESYKFSSRESNYYVITKHCGKRKIVHCLNLNHLFLFKYAAFATDYWQLAAYF